MYNAYIIKIDKLRPHINADRLQVLTAFDNDICVGLDVKIGDIGIYFPTDGQLSEEFCLVNDLVRRKDENGNAAGGYLDPTKRNVKTIRLRGEASDGLYLPISCLDYCFEGKKNIFKPGDVITGVINGHEICKKYIPVRRSRSTGSSKHNNTNKTKTNISPYFNEHADTEQLVYNLAAFHPGDLVEITLKMHGTSQRTGHLPVLKGFKGSNIIFDKIIKRYYNKEKMGKFAQKVFNKAMADATPIYDWGYVSGTRRTILKDFNGGFYGDNAFRKQHSDAIENAHFPRGVTVYYEVVGFTDHGDPIMSTCSNKKTNDPEFIKQYGDTTVFSYGCQDKESKMYVYRMTFTTDDGYVFEISPDDMRRLCKFANIETVPVFWKGYIPEDVENAGEWILNKANEFFDGIDPIGLTHIREGVVVRILNRPKFTAYKNKNISFKILEGIYKEAAVAPDREEAEDLAEEVDDCS